nr:MAG TPA: hypothetical protein [Bacteriophage sp.]
MTTIKTSRYTFTLENSVPEVGDIVSHEWTVTAVTELDQIEAGDLTERQWRDMNQRNVSYDFYRIESVRTDDDGDEDYDEDYIAVERLA